MSEQRARRSPLNAAFDPGGRRRRPRTSTAAAASVAPIARAPASAPNRNIAKTKSPPAATSPSCGHQPLHQPGGPSRSRCAAPELRPPPPRDKERQLASRKCRRESTPQPPSTRRSIRAVGAGDPVPRQRPQRRSLRSPELQRRPRTAISLKRSRRRRRHHHRAATSRCTNQAARAGRDAPRRNRGHHRQGIKNASSPAGNVGERARRSPPQRGVRSGRSAPATPYLDSGRSVGRSDRPSSSVGPEPQYR